MPTNMEEVGLAPPAPHPLEPSSQQGSMTAIMTETKDTATSDTGGAASTPAATPNEKNPALTATGSDVDRCSGCNASNVPLLACDNNILDQEKNQQQEEGEDGQQRQRFVLLYCRAFFDGFSSTW